MVSELALEYLSSLEAFSRSFCGHWKVQESKLAKVRWKYFLSDLDLPNQGWKIHVSATATEAIKLVEQVLPFLVEFNASFKLPANLEGFIYLNSGFAGSTQVGKILTVYPVNDEMLYSLCFGINKLWLSEQAPIVPFGLSLGSQSSVYIRYGSIASKNTIVNAQGQYTPAIYTPDGMLVPDKRDNPLGKPNWIQLFPFEWEFRGQNSQSEFKLGKNTYFPLRLIQSGVKGSVFIGVCGSTAAPVVIKTACRGVHSDFFGFDAIDRLNNEFNILTRLHNSGCSGLSPAPICFETGGLAVLVLEDIPGMPLHHLHRLSWNAKVIGIVALMRAVATLHSFGIVHRDIKLSNAVLVDTGVYITDFELACSLNDPYPLMGGTRNYKPPEGDFLSPSELATDLYALGICLVHIIFGYDPGKLPLGCGRMIGFLHLIGARDYIRLVSSLTNYIPSKRLNADAAAKALETIGARTPQLTSISPKRLKANRRWLIRAASEAVKRSVEFLIQESNFYTWRNEHLFSQYCCEGINLGASGIILGLSTIATSLKHRGFISNIGSSVKWLASRNPFHEAHGLFTGNAGVALAMCVGAGFTQDCDWIRARALERLTAAAKGVTEADLFHGAAGVVLAACLIAEVTGDSSSLEIVRHLATRLIRSPKRLGNLIIWEKADQKDCSAEYSIGAAHGAAGIASALARWSYFTADLEASTLAREVFLCIYQAGRSVDKKTLRYQISDSSSSAPTGTWCHGPAGFLWCMLYAFGDDLQLSQPIDWAVEAFDQASLVHNPTMCHGLSGQLELCRMLRVIPRHSILADQRATRITAALRLLQQRKSGLIAWSSENPDVFTPDLWVGFLGPAAVLSMSIIAGNDALLSGHWLRRCSEFAYSS